ncbi:MAG: hypothetical protein AB8B97_27840 [Granulosicoccus sp.]
MIVQLITAIVLAAMCVLFVWAGFRTFKRPMPRSMIPAIAAISAISYGIYSEYTWEGRTLAQMPDTIEVIHQFQGTSAFSPWSYLIPRTDRLSVVDTQTILRNPDLPDLAMIDLLLLQRFSPVVRARQLVDCSSNRRADLTMDQEFDDQGLPLGVQWDPLDDGHALINVVCAAQV